MLFEGGGILSQLDLFLNFLLAVIRLRELSEEVALDGVLKESILGLLAVPVHHIPDDVEVNAFGCLGLHDEFVLLVVSVGVHKRHHVVYDLIPLLLAQSVFI